MGQKVWETFTNQKQWESYLKNLVKTNDRALIKAIVLIYDLQTDEEKNTGKSVEDNKIGFSKIDAYELGNIAKMIKRGQLLAEAEIAKSRNKMQKYWKQLMIISKKQMQEKEDQKAKEELKQLEEEMYYEQLTFEDVFQIQEKTYPCRYGICDECESVEREKTLAKLESEVMAAIDSMHWIPVTEQLPTERRYYLAVIKRIAPDELGGNLTNVKIMRWLGEDWRYSRHIPEWINETITETVTHWMPLPAPPEERSKQ